MTNKNETKSSLSSFFHSYFSTTLFSEKEERVKRPLTIKPAFSSIPDSSLSFDLFIKYMSSMIHKVLPQEIMEALQTAQTKQERDDAFRKLYERLPLITWSDPTSAPEAICATVLVPANFTQGVGRYFTDSLSRWLIPGKFLVVFSAHSLNFHFDISKNDVFFIHQIVMQVENNKDLAVIKANLPTLAREITINVHAVKYARKMLASKRLKPEQKRLLIEEHISSILDRPSKAVDSNVFDQMHHFLLKLAGEEKEAKIKENFVAMINEKPALNDRDIYSEIRHFILLFQDKFTAMRSHDHISKTITLFYLFRKTLEAKVKKAPLERHLELKIFKTKITLKNRLKPVLSIILAVNIIEDNELLDQRHILAAIENIVPNVKQVKESFIVDNRSQERLRLFYLEIEKPNGATFSLKETIKLKKHLPRELKGRIENVIHPVVLTRNEEEVMRNIVMLSQELKYVQDIPQAYISFDTQVGQNLSFTVILLRLLHPKHVPISKTLSTSQSPLNFLDFETKQVGLLRKKYPKEANIFRVELDKTPFLRRDLSLDLFKARLVVSEELGRILGEIRDFNGGILSKQQEGLLSLKRALSIIDKSNDFLVENFFYSISPSIGRSILYTSLLKMLYLMMLDAFDHDFAEAPFWIQKKRDSEYTLIMISSPFGSFKKAIMQAIAPLHIDPLDLSSTFIDSNEITCLGLIYRCDDNATIKQLHKILFETMTLAIPRVSAAEGS